MSRSATLLIVLAALLASALSSCVRCIDIRLFNNSGDRITVVGINPTDERRTWEIDNGDSAIVWYQYRWEILKGAATWAYGPGKVSYPGPKYASGGYFGCLHLAAQLGPAGEIWMLAADAQGVVKAPPPQPVGYPVIPDNASGSVAR